MWLSILFGFIAGILTASIWFPELTVSAIDFTCDLGYQVICPK